MTTKKQPKNIVLTLKINPCRGAAALASSLAAPEGYVFVSMTRKGETAKVTFTLA